MKHAKSLNQQQLNHRADTLNSNRKTAGTNSANAKMNGNRGKQLNPNNRSKAHEKRA